MTKAGKMVMIIESRRDINMYNYMDEEAKHKLIRMLIDDCYTVEDVLLYVDELMGSMYKLGYVDGDLHA